MIQLMYEIIICILISITILCAIFCTLIVEEIAYKILIKSNNIYSYLKFQLRIYKIIKFLPIYFICTMFFYLKDQMIRHYLFT
jgi:hypothetical protein